MKRKIPTIEEKLEKVGLLKIFEGGKFAIDMAVAEEWLTSRTINGKTVSKSLASNINGFLFPEFLRILVTSESQEEFKICLLFANRLATDKDFEKFFNKNIIHTVELYLVLKMEKMLQSRS